MPIKEKFEFPRPKSCNERTKKTGFLSPTTSPSDPKSTKINNKHEIKMPPCLQDCTIRNLLKIAMKELDNLNHVREDLDDLSFNEPGRLAEVTAKLKAVTEIEETKMAEAQKLIIYTEFGCELCHPEEGLILE